MNRKKITALVLTLLLSTSTATVFAQEIKTNTEKTPINASLLNKQKYNDDDIVYTGGSKYFDETTGNYRVKGIIQNIDHSEKNPELAGESRLFFIKTEDKQFRTFVSILDCKIVGGYENIKEGTQIEVWGEIRNDTLVADKVIVNNASNEIIDYKDITDEIDNNEELSKWVSKNHTTKGVYLKNYNNENYILITAGECNTGGYSVNLNKLYTKEDVVYIDAEVQSPSKDVDVTCALTYPHLVIQLNSDNNFNNIVWNQVKINDFELNDSTTLGDIKNMFNSTDNMDEKLTILRKTLNFLQSLISL
jgi:protease stability complex PrcB-like protein